MPRPALPLVCAVALCVVASRAAAETDDMMRWKPAICGTRASCEIVDITAAGRGAGGANRPTYLPALQDIPVACGVGDGYWEVIATSGRPVVSN